MGPAEAESIKRNVVAEIAKWVRWRAYKGVASAAELVDPLLTGEYREELEAAYAYDSVLTARAALDRAERALSEHK